MGLGDDEQHELENILLENPRKGVVIEGWYKEIADKARRTRQKRRRTGNIS